MADLTPDEPGAVLRRLWAEESEAPMPEQKLTTAQEWERRLADPRPFNLAKAFPAPYDVPAVICPDCGRTDAWWPLPIVTTEVEAYCLCQRNKPAAMWTRLRLEPDVESGVNEWRLIEAHT